MLSLPHTRLTGAADVGPGWASPGQEPLGAVPKVWGAGLGIAESVLAWCFRAAA